MEFIWDLFCDFFPYKSQNRQRRQAMPSWFKLGSIWKPSTRPNSGSFPPAVHHFPLQYTKYSCGKMASAGEKSLAVGHIPGFQIDPNKKRGQSPLFLLNCSLDLLLDLGSLAGAVAQVVQLCPTDLMGGRKVNGAYPCRYVPFFNPTCGYTPLALPLGELSPKVTDTEIQSKSFLKILGSIWKPSTRPNSGSFPPAVHHFPL